MEFEEVHQFLIQERLRNENHYQDDINDHYGSSDEAWDHHQKQPTYHYFSYYNNNHNNNESFINKKQTNINDKEEEINEKGTMKRKRRKKKKKKEKGKTISSKFVYGVQKIKNKLEGLSMSASSGDESMDSLSNDEYESTFSRLFLNDPNTIPSVLLNDLSSPILSPIPNQHQLNQPMKNKNEERHDHYYPPSFFYESYLNHNKNKNKNISNNNNNNNIVSSIPLKKDHGSRSSINSGTTTSSSPSSLTPLSNFKLKNKSYYSKRARIKRHLGFFWRNHYYHHPHHHHSHYESKSLKSNNNSHPKLLKTVSSFPSLKTQHDSSNLTYHPSYDPSLKSSQEKEEFTLLNRTSNELLTQLSNSIQRVQCMIDIEIQSVEDHQKDILFYTNQLEQLDHDIDYLNQKINFMNKESNRDLMIEDLKDWHSSLLQSQQNHHLLLNRFESYYIRSIITKNPLPSLQLKTDLTLKSIHQMNLIRYWSLLIACKKNQ